MTTALATLAGLLLAGSFPKFGHPAFAWVALSPLVVALVLEHQAGGRALRMVRLGLLAGIVYFGGTVYWVIGVMAKYGDLATPVAVLIYVMMVAYLSIYPAFFAWLSARAIRRFGMAGVWLTPFLWVATEWIRSTIGGGFPWVLLGSSQAMVLPIVQLASVTGIYGLSLLVALVSAAAAAIVVSRRRVHLAGAAVVGMLVVGIAIAGTVRVARGTLTQGSRSVRIGLVQGDVVQDAKWNPAFAGDIMERQLDLSRRALALGASLVIWPESSTPFYFDADPARAEPVRRLAAQAHTPFLVGTDELERTGAGERYYNSAVLVGPDGRSEGSYRKMELVPFGEYVPMKRLLFFVGPLVEAVSDFSPGLEPRVFTVGGMRLSVAICYEAVYAWIARAFVQRGSELLVTITNDAWFDTSSAAYQHFEQAAIRSVEEGRYLVRAANTGISGAVDPYGRVIARTRLFDTTAIVVDVKLLDGRTIYNAIGDVIAWLSLAVGIVVLVRR